MIKKSKGALRRFRDDKSGSEAMEVVAASAMFVIFVWVAIMVFSYIMVASNVNLATKRISRQIETTGIVDTVQMRNNFSEMLPSQQIINKNIEISDVTYHEPGKVQLKETFIVTGSCDYVIQLINPGNFSGYRLELPIKVSVSGMSEVYWGKR